MRAIKNKKAKLLILYVLIGIFTFSCQKDDPIDIIESITLTTTSGNNINMDGVWSSGCVEANNNMILNESLIFNNKDLQINIKGFDNMQCNGTAIFNETVIISFNTTGTKTVTFEGEQVLVNKINGTAEYSDGRKETFKQIFFIDENIESKFMYHAIFENDGGQIDAEGYPIEIIPIPITKTS
ncbi:hypothetical protein [Pontimicrobium aquaticum]|uniref:Lipid-binding hydrolase n=1 Tax=Pontimicrobium aquaticum TaxID=2565367 RepID=A0A4U0F107_9FLAO|nr:hypothetical protein [Pontimicrobium aquaticum]TJY38076.1 hypothetical protein E5167_02120 [Pontimicrobium aquaticum]